MPSLPMSEALLRASLEAVREHGSVSAAARALGLPRGTVQHRVDRARQWEAGMPVPVTRTAPEAPPVAASSYEEAWRTWDAYIGRSRGRYRGPQTRQVGPRRKIVLIPDLHIPFHEPRLLADLVAEEGDADLAIVMGDLMDNYATSRFVQYERVPFAEEVAGAQQVLEVLSATYPEVLVIEGNHDARVERGLRERLPMEMVAAVQYLAGGDLRPVAALCKRFENVRLAEHVIGRHKASWFSQVGDLIVAHAEKYSRVPVSALRSITEWLDDFSGTLDLRPWKVLAQAHTHSMAWVPWQTDRVLLEVGCACQEHGYQFRARIGGRPQRRGWVTLVQEDGHTDLNSVRLVWWDARPGHAN